VPAFSMARAALSACPDDERSSEEREESAPLLLIENLFSLLVTRWNKPRIMWRYAAGSSPSAAPTRYTDPVIAIAPLAGVLLFASASASLKSLSTKT